MPGMDNTGPLGNGPVGRGMGPCGSGQAGQGRGRGFRRGGGAGLGRLSAMLSTDEEKGLLERQKDMLETQLATITQRLQGLDKSKENG